MKTWEYQILKLNYQSETQLTDALNQRGAQGWELFSFDKGTSAVGEYGVMQFSTLIFKREKQSPELLSD